jgi:hypothetical protein
MNGLDSVESDSGDTVFRDVIMLALAGFVAIVIILLPHLNPPAKAVEAAPPPGNIIVEIRWPDNLDTDVDLWVQAPGDMPVGYSNQGGVIFNLLRDDRGHRDDVSKVNYEIAYTRGMPAGEYIVNLHLYRNMSEQLPIPVTIVASVKPNPKVSAIRLVKSEIRLEYLNQEVTVFRFRLNEQGRLVQGSVHAMPKKLRTAAK